jgi:hypothetical protein
LEFDTHHRRTIRGKPKRWRNFGIRAEVNFVNPDEAKKLVTDEGYAVLDVRDKTQYERAHIKSCYHVPLFIQNQDNDFGKTSSFVVFIADLCSCLFIPLE